MTFRSNLTRLPGMVALAITVLGARGQCQSGTGRPAGGATSPPQPGSARTVVAPSSAGAIVPVSAQTATAEMLTISPDTQREFLLRSARTAWAFVQRETSPAGFIGATETYPYMTVWDMASSFAAAQSALDLDIIDQPHYRAFIDRALTTIEGMPLYDGAAFNKLYASRSGAMVDRSLKASTQGYGWSVLDHGRMLVWLRIIAARDSSFAARTQAIVSRLNMGRLVQHGYLYGEDLDPESGKTRSYQEGRVGYEQYAAGGFALWGARAEKALSFTTNGKPVTVEGATVLADARGNDLLTSEPFVMQGLELGWTGADWRPLSLAVLAAQEARFRETGIVTMISEDALPVAPAYFYYYLLWHNGKAFVVTNPSGTPSDSFPRWVSAKAAFGYHALAPSDYTWRALQTVKYGATTNRGWAAGVFEGTQTATKTFNLNTAALVLESAAYAVRGCPLIQPTCTAR